MTEHQVLGAMLVLQAILTAACIALTVYVLREVREVSPVLKPTLDAAVELLKRMKS